MAFFGAAVGSKCQEAIVSLRTFWAAVGSKGPEALFLGIFGLSALKQHFQSFQLADAMGRGFKRGVLLRFSGFFCEETSSCACFARFYP